MALTLEVNQMVDSGVDVVQVLRKITMDSRKAKVQVSRITSDLRQCSNDLHQLVNVFQIGKN